MSSNTSKGIGTKGSKLWMGLYANCESFRKTCEKEINTFDENSESKKCKIEFYHFKKNNDSKWELEKLKKSDNPYNCEENDIKFISPKAENNYEEYRFTQDELYKQNGSIDIKKKNDILRNWPKRAQGQWDGIAVDKLDNPEFLYLFEAKAHIDEIEKESASIFNKKNVTDREKIVNIIKTHFDIENKFDGSKLKKGESIYYQTINRLCFLYILEEFYKNNEIKFVIEPKLIFLNFYNDKTYESEKLDDIKKEYVKVWNDINPNTPSDNVYIAFVDVADKSKELSIHNAELQKNLMSIWEKNLKELFENKKNKNKESELLSTYNAGLQKKLMSIWKKNLKDLFEKQKEKNKK